MIDSMLIHLATIVRPDQTATSKVKDTTETSVATNVECLIAIIASSPDAMELGFGDSENAIGYFLQGTDIQEGDEVTRTDESDNTVWTVEGVENLAATVTGDDHHLEAQLRRKDVG